MNYQPAAAVNASDTIPWPAAIAGFIIFIVSLVHIPDSLDALNYFDPPKRLVWSALAFVLSCVWSLRTNRLNRIPLILAFALVGWIAIRTLFKQNPGTELEVFFTWILPLQMFILAGSMDQERGAKIVGYCLLTAGILQAVVMLLQNSAFDPFFFTTTSGMDYKPGRMIGTIGYQNQAVDFLALSAASIFLIGRIVTVRLALFIGAIAVAGLTANRGGIVAFIFALLASHGVSIMGHDLWSTRFKWIAATGEVLGAVGLFVFVMLIPGTNNRFREVFTDIRHSPAAGSRIVMARIGIDMFAERPWTGWGAGEYARQYLERLGVVMPVEKTPEMLTHVVNAREAHNDYLQFAVEFGIPGIVLAAALFGVVVTRIVRGRNHNATAIAALVFVIVYMAISSLFSFPWQTSMGGPLAGFLVGLLLPKHMESGRTGHMAFTVDMPRFARYAVKVTVVAGSLFIAAWFARDALINTALPDILIRDGPDQAKHLLSRYDYRYRAMIGAVCASRGLFVEAETQLNMARHGYLDIALLNNLGHVQAKMGKWNEARTTYAMWVASGLDHSDALLNLSIACEQTGQYREAAAAIARRNAIWGDLSAAGIKRMAVLQLQSGDPRGALKTIREYRQRLAGEDAKTLAEIDNLTGGIWLMLGEKRNAAKWFRRALERNPGLESARHNLNGLSAMPARGVVLNEREDE